MSLLLEPEGSSEPERQTRRDVAVFRGLTTKKLWKTTQTRRSYNYRGVSKYRFPMYLKKAEHCFNHRKENLFKQFMNIYFGYVSR